MSIADIAGWIAPIATAVAAIMTAANLGARITGWGFVVFLVGSLAWSAVGASTGQTNLLLTNGFLTLVNLLGVWRWLGRQVRYERGGDDAAKASEQRAAPDLRTLSSLIGSKVRDDHDREIGEAIEALVERESGRLSYVVVRSGGLGGVGERLRAIRRDDLTLGKDVIGLLLDGDSFEALPDWVPEAPPVPAAYATDR